MFIFMVVLDSSVGPVRAALSSFRIYLTGAQFPRCILYEVFCRQRMHVRLPCRRLSAILCSVQDALQMNWSKGGIPAKILYILHPCRHHLESEHIGAGSTDMATTEEDRPCKQAQADQCHQKVPIATIVPTLARGDLE